MTTLMLPRRVRIGTALALLLYWSTLQVAPAAASLAPSQPSGASTVVSVRDAELIMIRQTLEHRIVAQKLRDYGVTSGEVETRLATMSDQDVHTLASACKGLPSGADDAVGVLIGLLVVVILVIVILKLLNKEVIVR